MLSSYCSHIILASKSPARKRLLEEAGLKVTIAPTGIDERSDETDPARLVSLLASRKLDAYLALNECASLPVLSCDTTIAFAGDLVGKSATLADAHAQLTAFSGRSHYVYSAWSLYYEGRIINDVDVATVHMRKLTDEDIETYLATDEWRGAAGAYRLQGNGASLIDSIEGDETCVIGLPMRQLTNRLAALSKRQS